MKPGSRLLQRELTPEERFEEELRRGAETRCAMRCRHSGLTTAVSKGGRHRGGAVDLYEVASIADLVMRLDDAMAGVGGKTGETLQRIAAGVSVTLGVVKIDFRNPAASRPELIALLHTQLNLITSLAKRTPLLVVFDEFSSIARVDGAAGILRTHLQHSYQDMGLLFAGSEPSMMNSLFADQAQPFYAQADLIDIGPLSTADALHTINAGFASTDRGAGSIGPAEASSVETQNCSISRTAPPSRHEIAWSHHSYRQQAEPGRSPLRPLPPAPLRLMIEVGWPRVAVE